MGLLVSIFWGVLSAILGFSILSGWQAWVIIVAGNVTYLLGGIKNSKW